MRISVILTFLFFWAGNLFGQTEGITHSRQKTGQPPFPVKHYKELPNPIATNSDLWKNASDLKISWGTIDDRYKKETPMPFKKEQSSLTIYGWKGERVSAQWVVSNYGEASNLSYEVSDLVNTKNASQKITQEDILSGFVRYVMTDELNKDGKGGCGYRDNTDFDSSLVADVIDDKTTSLKIPHQSTRPGWVRIRIPENAQAGKYRGIVTLKSDQQVVKKLNLVLEVSKQQLPQPQNWNFHLDLWQNPYAVARYYGVKPWSKAHFEHLKKDMRPYVNAGGKVITASIIHKPWDGQTHDYFETMVTWMKKADGSWYFDYTIFDKWVQFMMDQGVDQQINCYSMIPWKLSFQYYDQATNQLQYLKTKPGEAEFEEFWGRMLTSFARHLKEKGWFDKTYIAMDERPMEAMQATLKVIHKADKDFKVALAGNLHKELIHDIDDYCISYGQHFSEETLREREAAGQTSTYYTSCSQPYPNTFTFSPPAEAEWLGWSAAAQHLDGYLRWAYNSWVLEPLLDSRFTTWAAGDTYLVYPGGRISIRFERLVQGIQQYEKIQILRKTLNKRKLKKLEEIVSGFQHLNPEKETAAKQIIKAKKALRKLH